MSLYLAIPTFLLRIVSLYLTILTFFLTTCEFKSRNTFYSFICLFICPLVETRSHIEANVSLDSKPLPRDFSSGNKPTIWSLPTLLQQKWHINMGIRWWWPGLRFLRMIMIKMTEDNDHNGSIEDDCWFCKRPKCLWLWTVLKVI